MKLRLGAFVFSIGLLLFLILWAALISWRRVEESRDRFESVQTESVRIAGHLQEAILNLNDRLLGFAVKLDTNDWARFESDWSELDHWLDQQYLSSPAEKQILNSFNAAYDEYHQAAREIHRRLASGAGGFPLPEFVQFQSQGARLLNVSFELAEAHRSTLLASLAGSNRDIAHLHELLAGALGLLVVLGAWLSVVIYRQLISPLKLKLIESQALVERQEKLASLGVLAAGVAHEIRNPLTAIKAWLFMHQRKLQPGTQDAADAEVIAGELDRLERIVRDFLLFARPSEPEFQTVPAGQPLREVRELMGQQLARSGIQLVLEPSPEARIQIDAQQIKQVLINLVQNAAESIGRNGSITLRVRLGRRRLAAPADTEIVVLEVADTGKGIPPEVEKRLFDPFFTTKETGTGLGLSIAARILEKHGGALQYKTQVNYGTTFGILLPRVKGDEDQNPAH